MIFLESQTEFPGISVVTFLTDRLQVHLVELALHRHLLVAGGAGEVVHAPGLVQGRENVSLDDLKMTLSSTLLWNTKIGKKAATTLLFTSRGWSGFTSSS